MNDFDFSDLVNDEDNQKSIPTIEKEETTEIKKEEVKNETEIIPVIPLLQWFSLNKEEIFKSSGVVLLTLKLKGINPDDYLVLTAPCPTTTDPEKRILVLIPNPENIFVLDLPLLYVKLTPMSITIISKIRDKVVKTYNTFSQKSVFIRNPNIDISVCSIIDWNLLFSDMKGESYIPYKVTKISKKDFENTMQIKIDIINVSKERQLEILESKAPTEELIVKYYPQLQNQTTTIKLWKDVVRHLLEKQEIVSDTNHMIQIDRTLSVLFTYV